jgi:hypothetical protein
MAIQMYFFITCGGPLDPLRNPSRARNRPPGAGNEVSRPSGTIPGSTQSRTTTNTNTKIPPDVQHGTLRNLCETLTFAPAVPMCATTNNVARPNGGWSRQEGCLPPNTPQCGLRGATSQPMVWVWGSQPSQLGPATFCPPRPKHVGMTPYEGGALSKQGLLLRRPTGSQARARRHVILE